MASDDDKGAALKAVLERLSQRARRPVTLPSLIEGWQRFVDEVTTGYDATIYDYTNSLSLRDHLGEVIAALRPGAAYEIEREISAADERYRAATRASDRPLLPLSPGLQSWWWFRVPIRAGDELRGDLRSEGFGEVDSPNR